MYATRGAALLQKKQRRVAPQMSELVVYCKSTRLSEDVLLKITNFELEANGRCEHMISFNETKAKNLMVDANRRQFQRFHKKYLSRTYPKVFTYYPGITRCVLYLIRK